MKIGLLKAAIADLADDMEVYFLSNGVEEFRVDAALEMQDINALYLGETDQGLADSMDELDSMDGADWAQRQAWLDAADEDDEADAALDAYEVSGDDLDSAAVEGSDLPTRDPEMACGLPVDRCKVDSEQYLEAM